MEIVIQNSQSYRVMANILMSGESSEAAIMTLLPTDNYRQKLLSRLLSDKQIRKFQKDDLNGYRLTKKGKKELLSMDLERFAFFGADNADFTMRRTALHYRKRQHRISEVLAMMECAEVEIYRDKKTKIFQKDGMQAEEIAEPAFFHVKEVKEQEELTRKIINSKIVGVWCTMENIWLCYNAYDEKPQWYENVERRADILLRSMLNRMEYGHTNALLFGRDMQQAKQYLQDVKQVAFFLNGPFAHLCYIPLNEQGVFLLRLLASQELYQYLLSLLSEDLTEQEKDTYFIHDGFNQEGEPVLICIDGDLKRLIQFRTQLQYADRNNEVICFDFQKEAIKEYCGEKTKISTVDSEKIRRNFFGKSC